MEASYNIQNIIKHIVNGTLSNQLCRICLLPLDEYYEDVFTSVCKLDKDYSVADILEEVCCIKVSHADQSKVCSKCFMAASEAYKFYLRTKSTEEILNYYIDEIYKQLYTVNIPEGLTNETLCLSLPIISPVTKEFDYNITNFPFKSVTKLKDLLKNKCYTKIKPERIPITASISNKNPTMDTDFDDIVIVMDEKGESINLRPQNGFLVTIDVKEEDSSKKIFKQPPKPKSEKKQKRKRNPMSYIMCSKCPIQYRFVGKLKEHMKIEHGIDIFMCKVCKTIMENEHEFNKHLQTHIGIHTCAICNAVFKKRKSIISHLNWHEATKYRTQDGVHICEICGVVLFSEELLEEHKEKKHVNKYTCYYCGRMYKVEISFEAHIKKHEMHMTNQLGNQKKQSRQETKSKRKLTCSKCGRQFVDPRALLWHERLHAGERPHACAQCGRRFVTLARRNQHALCAHSAPARRCPLCPALFHLRSMVNSHIKKVHLQAHKRRARGCAPRDVFWKTEPVPLQELSVAVQDELFRLQSARNECDAE